MTGVKWPRMPRILVAFLLLGLLATPPGTMRAATRHDDEQQLMPAGISCCDEHKIRAAMTEEALRRIAAICEGGRGQESDYLSVQAHTRIRRRLPAGGHEERLDFLRRALQQSDPDEDTREFQNHVGHFILGMTLEIGHTFQDEYDLARTMKEKVDLLRITLEDSSLAEQESLSRALFHADLTEKELRRFRTLEKKWKDKDAGASSFAEFSELRRTVHGLAADPDQRMAFMLAERYRAAHPFLDEFLKNYRRLVADFRETVRRLNELLTARQE